MGLDVASGTSASVSASQVETGNTVDGTLNVLQGGATPMILVMSSFPPATSLRLSAESLIPCFPVDLIQFGDG
jgi:hypothetical protein